MSERNPVSSHGIPSPNRLQKIRDIIKHPDFGSHMKGILSVGAIGLSAVALISLENKENSGSLVPAKSCPAPTTEATQTVNKLFGGMFDTNKLPLPTQNFVDKTLSDPSWREKAAAKKYHLTFVDQSPAVESIALNYWDNQNVPTANEEVKIMQDYLAKFGVSLQVGSKKPVEEFQNPTLIDVQSEVSASLSRIAEGLRYIPAEYIHLSGLKKIFLMKSSSENYVYNYPDTLYWDISGNGLPREIDQAVYDGIDYEECGDVAGSDPGYVTLNPRHNIYGNGNHKGLTIFNSVGIYRRPRDFKNGVKGMKDLQNKNISGYCRIQEGFAAEASKEVVADQDGFTGVVDDKEALGGMIASPTGNFSDLLDPSRPVLRAKTEFLLARLYDQPYPGAQLGPELVHYYADVTGRPLPVGGDVDCTKY